MSRGHSTIWITAHEKEGTSDRAFRPFCPAEGKERAKFDQATIVWSQANAIDNIQALQSELCYISNGQFLGIIEFSVPQEISPYRFAYLSLVELGRTALGSWP